MTIRSISALPAFIRESQRATQAVLRESLVEVGRVMNRPKAKGGRMPVDTGFLRNSLQARLNGSTIASGVASFEILGQTLEPGQVVELIYGANYAAAVNNGARGRAGDRFVEGAADAWPAIVRGKVEKARAVLAR